MRLTWQALVVIGCACSVAGCGGAPPRVPDPQRSVAELEAALQRGDASAVYALLDPELRASLDRAAFERLWQDTAAERQELLAALQGTDGQLAASAHVVFDSGEDVGLVLEDGQWRIAGGVLDAASLRTPEDAVRALHLALERRSLEGLLRVLSAERRAAWQAAFEATVAGSLDSADLQVEVRGDTAEVRITGGGLILLVREAGQWHVTDVR
jgi:hypothetical protein